MAHGKSLELAKITRSAPVAVHQHTVTGPTSKRYKDFGFVPNRAGRRALGRSRGVLTPRPTMKPFEKA